jgi:hypothetical protein
LKIERKMELVGLWWNYRVMDGWMREEESRE